MKELLDRLKDCWKIIKKNVTQSFEVLQNAYAGRTRASFEGAQGTLLDRSWGSYPYVTSSNTIVDSVGIGAGYSARLLDEVLSVFKAYGTRGG